MLYHYTDKDSADKIWESGVIFASREINGDAIFGTGVYLTPFGPEHGKKFNAFNNYNTELWQQKEDQGKVDCVIMITMSNENIEEIITNDSPSRHIFVFKNNDLNLRGNNIIKVEFMYGPGKTVLYYSRAN